MTPEKPVVGVMSPLPVMGAGESDDDADGPAAGSQPWVFFSELKRDFNVKKVEMTADKIPDDVKVLVVIHPKGITDATQYALDQFVLRGGKLIAFLDPLCALDRSAARPEDGAAEQFESRQAAQGLGPDLRQHQGGRRPGLRRPHQRGPRTPPSSRSMKSDQQGRRHHRRRGQSFMAFAGAFTGTPARGLKETVLIKSSKIRSSSMP